MDSLFRLIQIVLIITQFSKASSSTTTTTILAAANSTISLTNSSPISNSSLYLSSLVSQNTSSHPIPISLSKSPDPSSLSSSNTTSAPSLSQASPSPLLSQASLPPPSLSPSQSTESQSLQSTVKTTTTNSSVPLSSQGYRGAQTSNTLEKTYATSVKSSTADTGSIIGSITSVQVALISSSAGIQPQPGSTLHPASSADLNATESKAPDQTVPINSSSASQMTLNNSGPATTPAEYSTSSYSLSESSTVTVSPTTMTVSSTAQSLTTSAVSVCMSINCTDWSVDSSDCQRHCSDVGGTVTASRQCYSHTVTLKDSVCTKYSDSKSKKVVKCGEHPHCPTSGTESSRSSILSVTVGILLFMLPNFVGG